MIEIIINMHGKRKKATVYAVFIKTPVLNIKYGAGAATAPALL
jgi:hypothetical protein